MRRPVRSGERHAAAPPARLTELPRQVTLPLDRAVNRCALTPCVAGGASVARGEAVAQGDDLTLAAPLAGTVSLAADRLTITADDSGRMVRLPPPPADAAALPAFAAAAGLAGMGGSHFPAAVKLRAAAGATTLIINAVECEPRLAIDESLLLHETATVRAGADWLAQLLNLSRTVVAVQHAAAVRARRAGYELLTLPDTYPAGAERLIVQALTGKPLPPGVLPMRRGCLVFSVATLHALGRAVRDGEPCVERPLTVWAPGRTARNLIVPVGTPAAHILAQTGLPGDAARDVLIAGGMMMGQEVTPDFCVTRATNALLVVPRAARLVREEGRCIRCGACHDACPLGLHPSYLRDEVRAQRHTPALAAQLDDCFLCGACAAACPADIRLAYTFREGKTWLRARR